MVVASDLEELTRVSDRVIVLPGGTVVAVLEAGAPSLVLGDELISWSPSGYGERRRRPKRGTATAITPPATLAVLRAGYPVQIDAQATQDPTPPTDSGSIRVT